MAWRKYQPSHIWLYTSIYRYTKLPSISLLQAISREETTSKWLSVRRLFWLWRRETRETREESMQKRQRPKRNYGCLASVATAAWPHAKKLLKKRRPRIQLAVGMQWPTSYSLENQPIRGISILVAVIGGSYQWSSMKKMADIEILHENWSKLKKRREEKKKRNYEIEEANQYQLDSVLTWLNTEAVFPILHRLPDEEREILIFY